MGETDERTDPIERDDALVQLLAERLGERTYSFAEVLFESLSRGE